MTLAALVLWNATLIIINVDPLLINVYDNQVISWFSLLIHTLPNSKKNYRFRYSIVQPLFSLHHWCNYVQTAKLNLKNYLINFAVPSRQQPPNLRLSVWNTLDFFHCCPSFHSRHHVPNPQPSKEILEQPVNADVKELDLATCSTATWDDG